MQILFCHIVTHLSKPRIILLFWLSQSIYIKLRNIIINIIFTLQQ